MSVSVVSSDIDLFLSLRGSGAKKSVESKGTTSFNALLQQAKEATSTTKAETTNSTQLEIPEELRRRIQVYAIGVSLTGSGRWDSSTSPARGTLQEMTNEYFGEVKEKYGCTEDYKPYLEGLSEFNPKIETAIWAEVRERMNADPRTQGLIKQVEGIYPIPEKFNPDSTYGSNRIRTLT